jgi:hypothetical protein
VTIFTADIRGLSGHLHTMHSQYKVVALTQISVTSLLAVIQDGGPLTESGTFTAEKALFNADSGTFTAA